LEKSHCARQGREGMGEQLLAVTIWTNDIVIVEEKALADQTDVALEAGETAAVPVTTFKRHITRPLGAETCVTHIVTTLLSRMKEWFHVSLLGPSRNVRSCRSCVTLAAVA